MLDQCFLMVCQEFAFLKTNKNHEECIISSDITYKKSVCSDNCSLRTQQTILPCRIYKIFVILGLEYDVNKEMLSHSANLSLSANKITPIRLLYI